MCYFLFIIYCSVFHLQRFLLSLERQEKNKLLLEQKVMFYVSLDEEPY